jgi:hypothetical protein
LENSIKSCRRSITTAAKETTNSDRQYQLIMSDVLNTLIGCEQQQQQQQQQGFDSEAETSVCDKVNEIVHLLAQDMNLGEDYIESSDNSNDSWFNEIILLRDFYLNTQVSLTQAPQPVDIDVRLILILCSVYILFSIDI